MLYATLMRSSLLIVAAGLVSHHVIAVPGYLPASVKNTPECTQEELDLVKSRAFEASVTCTGEDHDSCKAAYLEQTAGPLANKLSITVDIDKVRCVEGKCKVACLMVSTQRLFKHKLGSC